MKRQLPLDQINQRAWKPRDASRQFLRSRSWIVPGEKAALDQIAGDCRDQPRLEIGAGVGTGAGVGRTIPQLAR